MLLSEVSDKMLISPHCPRTRRTVRNPKYCHAAPLFLKWFLSASNRVKQMLRSLRTEESIQHLEGDTPPRRAKTRDEILDILIKSVERIEVVRGDDVGPVPNAFSGCTTVMGMEVSRVVEQLNTALN
jgi:hypothetical protein